MHQRGTERLRFARSDGPHVEPAITAGHQEALANGRDGRGAFRQRIGVQRQLIHIEPVEGRGLSLGMDGDKRQRAADTDGSLEVTAIREMLIGRRGSTDAPPSSSRRSTSWV